jgi:hypothetical protein
MVNFFAGFSASQAKFLYKDSGLFFLPRLPKSVVNIRLYPEDRYYPDKSGGSCAGQIRTGLLRIAF